MTTKTNSDLHGRVLNELQTYQRDSETSKTHALIQKQPSVLAAEMGLEKWIRAGGLDEDNVSSFLVPYLENSQHIHHPGYIGHQVAVPHEGAAIADMVHGVINNPMAVYEMGPTASVIERVVINWMLEKTGWFTGQIDGFEQDPSNGAGVLTHGGSLANLTAVLAARARAFPKSWREGTPQNLGVIAPAATHYSLARAVSIAGLGQDAMCYAPVNGLDVLQPEKLEATYRQALDAGKNVFMVSANACTTATGFMTPSTKWQSFARAIIYGFT